MMMEASRVAKPRSPRTSSAMRLFFPAAIPRRRLARPNYLMNQFPGRSGGPMRSAARNAADCMKNLPSPLEKGPPIFSMQPTSRLPRWGAQRSRRASARWCSRERSVCAHPIQPLKPAKVHERPAGGWVPRRASQHVLHHGLAPRTSLVRLRQVEPGPHPCSMWPWPPRAAGSRSTVNLGRLPSATLVEAFGRCRGNQRPAKTSTCSGPSSSAGTLGLEARLRHPPRKQGRNRPRASNAAFHHAARLQPTWARSRVYIEQELRQKAEEASSSGRRPGGPANSARPAF